MFGRPMEIPTGSETYGCQRCRCRFKGPRGQVTCPYCHGLYVKWLSYPQYLVRKKGNGSMPPQAKRGVRKRAQAIPPPA